MRRSLGRLAASLLFFSTTAPAAAADSAEAFRTHCAACHTLDGVSTKSGPSLNGVVWRKVAVLPDFAYSGALRSMGGTWSPARLDAFLRNAQALAPGSDMWWEMEDPATRRAIIDYLKSTR